MTHEHSSQNDLKRLFAALLLICIFFIIEVIGGLLTNSLAILSDAAHVLTDVMALFIAITAIKFGNKPSDFRRTFGYKRLEILAAALNAAILILVSIYILYEAIFRFFNPAPINTDGMLIIGSLGVIINLISLKILHSTDSNNLNIKAAYLEVFADMLGSLAVITAGLVIRYTGWLLIDPILAVLIGFLVLPRAYKLLLESINILLNGVPQDVDIQKLYDDLINVPCIDNVHDLHVWAITSGHNSLTAHIVVSDLDDPSKVINDAKSVARLHKIEHTNFQIETTICSHNHNPM